MFISSHQCHERYGALITARSSGDALVVWLTMCNQRSQSGFVAGAVKHMA